MRTFTTAFKRTCVPPNGDTYFVKKRTSWKWDQAVLGKHARPVFSGQALGFPGVGVWAVYTDM